MLKEQLFNKTKSLLARLFMLQGEYKKAASEYKCLIEYLSHRPIDSKTSLIDNKESSG